MCEAPTVCRVSISQARKERVCEECLRVIAIGEIYEYVWGIWDGEPEALSTCAECWEVREDLRNAKREGGAMYEDEIACDLSFGRLQEALADEIRETSTG